MLGGLHQESCRTYANHLCLSWEVLTDIRHHPVLQVHQVCVTSWGPGSSVSPPASLRNTSSFLTSQKAHWVAGVPHLIPYSLAGGLILNCHQDHIDKSFHASSQTPMGGPMWRSWGSYTYSFHDSEPINDSHWFL